MTNRPGWPASRRVTWRAGRPPSAEERIDGAGRDGPDLVRGPVRALGAGELERDGARLLRRTGPTGTRRSPTSSAAAALWNYSLFFHGEDSVTDNLSPYIDAAPREEQKYFLATQQVDEARHAVFFARFMKEVVGRGETIAGSLAATQPELTWGVPRDVRDARRRRRPAAQGQVAPEPRALGRACTTSSSRRRSRSRGSTSSRATVQERDILPGFRAGMENVSRDEQRHIGFGVKLVSDLIKEDPDCTPAIADLLREAMPKTVGVFVPPNWDMRYIESFGSTMVDVYEQGMKSLEQKLRAAGCPFEELPGPPPIPLDMTARERSELSIALMKRGHLRREDRPAGARPRDGRAAVRLDPPRRRHERHAERRGGDPVGFHRHGAVAPRRRQRRDARREGPPRGSGPDFCAAASSSGLTSSPAATIRAWRWRSSSSARAATFACCCGWGSCSGARAG